MFVDIFIEIDEEKTRKNLSAISDQLDNILDDVIFTFIRDLKDYALQIRTWGNRSGALERAHFIEPLEDGWRLRVDVTETSDKDYNYAWALERGWLSQYAWIMPALDVLEAELPGRLDKALQEAIKKV